MIRNGCNSLSRNTALASAALAAFLASGSGALAGKTDLETGEQCWGTGCIDQELPVGSGSNDAPTPGPVLPANVTVEECSTVDAERIGFTVTWLQNNLPAIDAVMRGSDALEFWPGNTRENFAGKLRKELRFVCVSDDEPKDEKKCDRWSGKTFPILHQNQVKLCTDAIEGDAHFKAWRVDELYVHVIAHEIGHLIRLNNHWGDCSFSEGLGYAAEYAFKGASYQPSVFADECPGTSTQPFSIDDKLNSGNMEKPLTLDD